MKKINYLFLSGALIMGMTLTQSCKKEGCTDAIAENYDEDAKEDDGSCTYIDGCTDEDALNYDATATMDDGSCEYEFVADDNTFSGFMSWELAATFNGADPSLGAAHGGNDSMAVREIFFLDSQDPVDGVYPTGTVIVKYTTLSTGDKEVTAMVKRGDDFDTDGADWEYFMLNEDGTIADGGNMRGADLMGGMCKGCHSYATNDYVFAK